MGEKKRGGWSKCPESLGIIGLKQKVSDDQRKPRMTGGESGT